MRCCRDRVWKFGCECERIFTIVVDAHVLAGFDIARGVWRASDFGNLHVVKRNHASGGDRIK